MNDAPGSAPTSAESRLPQVAMEAQLRAFRQLLLASLAGGLALAVGVNLFLFRQVSMVTKDLQTSRRLVEDYEKTKKPLLESLVTALQDFSKAHPDFSPILEKYGLKQGASGTPKPTGSAGTGDSGR